MSNVYLNMAIVVSSARLVKTELLTTQILFWRSDKTGKKHWFQKFKAGPENLKSLFRFLVVARPSIKKSWQSSSIKGKKNYEN